MKGLISNTIISYVMCALVQLNLRLLSILYLISASRFACAVCCLFASCVAIRDSFAIRDPSDPPHPEIATEGVATDCT